MIQTIEQFISKIREGSSCWPVEQPRWFRGEPECATPLLPTLYRSDHAGCNENPLLQMFRARAPGFYPDVPDRERTDEWLFLARHAGLPTRLLDWSEGALTALHFALKAMDEPPVVWMLNPLRLNHAAAGYPTDTRLLREFPLPWLGWAHENIRGAWEDDRPGHARPVAVYPTYVHPRLRGQRSCFTVHGKQKKGLQSLVAPSILKCYRVDPASRQKMLRDLSLLGITESVAFPDLDGLASELRRRFSLNHHV